jgi:hypothetical protein
MLYCAIVLVPYAEPPTTSNSAEHYASSLSACPTPGRAGPAPLKTITGITGPISLQIEFDTEH